MHVICPEPPGARGGADLHVRDLACAQNGRGINARVLVLSDKSFAETIAAAGAPASTTTVLRAPAHVAAFLKNASATKGANSRRKAIVHAHGYEADYAASIGRLLAGHGAVVMTSHGFLRTDRRMRLMTALDLISMRRASAIIAAGSHHAQELGKRFNVVEHVPNGTLGPARIRRPTEAGRRRLGFVGRLSIEKRPRLMIEITRRLAARGLRVETHIFGGGPLFESLRSEARMLARGAISLRGFVEDTDAIYEGMDVFVLCSDTESSPRVVLEAMARGVVIVSCAVGDVPEILDQGRCGILAHPDDIDGLVAGCERVLLDASLRAELIDRARQRWMERYGFGPMVDRIHEVYDRVTIQ
jgi:glycosyltransferase involved in cell wall biosynthesis